MGKGKAIFRRTVMVATTPSQTTARSSPHVGTITTLQYGQRVTAQQAATRISLRHGRVRVVQSRHSSQRRRFDMEMLVQVVAGRRPAGWCSMTRRLGKTLKKRARSWTITATTVRSALTTTGLAMVAAQ